MKIQRDVAVPTRSGNPVSVNVFTPEGDGPWPVITTMSPYGKDIHWSERYATLHRVRSRVDRLEPSLKTIESHEHGLTKALDLLP